MSAQGLSLNAAKALYLPGFYHQSSSNFSRNLILIDLNFFSKKREKDYVPEISNFSSGCLYRSLWI